MMKKLTAALAVLLTFVLCALPVSAAVLTAVETQFSHNTSNPAWLKSLVARENMTDPQAIANALTLTAKPEYPYSATPESFREEVGYFVALYSLDENSQKAAYLYVLQYVNQFASEATRNVSDEFIMEYLTDAGIAYPDGGLGDYENLIVARALYTLLSSGAVKIDIQPGTTVQAALILCLTQTLNIDASQLAQWSVSSVDTLDEYVLAACKIALNTNGFTVSRDTPEQEVYRLTAVMMVRRLGIAIDEKNATPEELRLKYLAALLGVQYDVSLDPTALGNAIDRSEVPLYILRTMGREANVTVRSDMGLSDAFNAVAENTDRFSLENGEFYADIENYETTLQYKRDRIWICPTAYRASSATETIMVYVDGEFSGSGVYAEVALDPEQSERSIPITVTYQSPQQTVSKTYTLTVRQGTREAPATQDPLSSAVGNGNSLLGIFTNNLGNTLAGTFYTIADDLPERVSGILTLMTPEFNEPAGDPLTPNASGSSAGSLSSGGDYLSRLMFSVSGGVSQQAGVPTPQAGALGPGGVSGGVFGLGISFSAPVAGALTGGVPMLLSEAGDPPDGYEFETDGAGYITGLRRLSTAGLAAKPSVGRADPVAAVGRRLLLLAIPAGLAVLTVAAVLYSRRRERRRGRGNG